MAQILLKNNNIQNSCVVTDFEQNKMVRHSKPERMRDREAPYRRGKGGPPPTKIKST